MQFEWKGVFPALLTPFTANDELDLPMFEKKSAGTTGCGIHGVIIGGTLGESKYTNLSRKEQLVKCGC
jgi:4-hydroxy-tetrahydrodipicolinate synthase